LTIKETIWLLFILNIPVNFLIVWTIIGFRIDKQLRNIDAKAEQNLKENEMVRYFKELMGKHGP